MGAVCVESEAADLNKTNQRDTMRTSSTLLLFGLVAAVHGGLFVQDGQEYEYFTTITSAAGTMDGATHSAGEQYTMKVQLRDDVEIFKYVKWGSTVHVYSFMRVWVATDNTFVQVLPAPSTRGQHCGMCGTFNRNIYDEWMGKDGQTLITSAAAMVDEWKWKC